MHLRKMLMLLMCCFLSLLCVTGAPNPEEPLFELPVQLVGFPVIIAAVRISNFVKKLAYSFNPETYRSRTKREIPHIIDDTFIAKQVVKEICSEFGNSVYILENVCTKYVEIALKKKLKPDDLEWNVIVRRYKTSPTAMKENYLLSVFLGNIFVSTKLCHQLAQQKKSCLKDFHVHRKVVI